MGSFPDICCYRKAKIVEDFPVQIHNTIENSYNTRFLTQPNFSSLIFLQIRIKRYLINKNSKANQQIYSKFFNNHNNTKTSSNMTYANNLITNTIIHGNLRRESTSKFNINLRKETTDKEEINESHNNQNNININEVDILEEKKANFPKIILNKDSNMFKDNLFIEQNNNKKSNKDPRNGPFDGERRKYPIIYHDQYSYEGEWKNGKRDGIGILINKEGAKYIGEFKENKMSGFCKFWAENGDEFIGYWEDHKANGLGIYNKKGYISYKGWWKNDKQNGFGIEKWPNVEYIGEYLNGKKEGYGIFNIKGGIYEGQMKNENMNGIGSFEFKDKRQYKGEFLNNKLEGCGILTWPDGKVFIGNFKDDLIDGFGVFYSGAKIYIGIWNNMILEGEVIVIGGGKRKKELWEQGKCTKILPSDYKIYFEKYVDDIINQKDFYIIK